MKDVRIAVDHVLHDGVGHDFLTPEVFAKCKDAEDQLSRFKVPRVVNANNRHDKLFSASFDGVGNKKYSDPAHATNISSIHNQVNALGRFGYAQVVSHYIDGPGTLSGWFVSTRDSYNGSTYVSNISSAYDSLVRQANRWRREDPACVIRVHVIGFSRGASQVPGFARLVHERDIPDLQSETITADRTITYSRKLVEPGTTIQTVGLFDPVATGIPITFNRRLPPSVVCGFQITAANEKRVAFTPDRLIPPGYSDDGRFLSVRVPGSHSDVGGGYGRDGLSIRWGNLMRDYCNALRDEPYLQKEYQPTDMRINVIHRSAESMSSFRHAMEVLILGWIPWFAMLGAVLSTSIQADMGIRRTFYGYAGIAVGVLVGVVVGIYRADVRGERA